MSTPASVKAGREFARAWEQGHISSMYALLSDEAKRTTSARAFANAYDADADTATLRSLRVTRVRRQGDGVVLGVVAGTRIFGTIRGQIELPMKDGHVDWSPRMTFPDKPSEAKLSRQTTAPESA